ncbi:MAG: cysteine dioxygenase family protein [Candidatus Latescibacterota bacterium]|nr:MAG: cysteine dioxygenase family protein [Candidatus Latescibacterota bacterium]
MGNPNASSASVDSLMRRLDHAASVENAKTICRNIKDVLMEELGNRRVRIPEEYLAPVTTGYARRLLYKDHASRFSVVVMVWGPGQGTPLHDHAGHWCVECVYEGRIRVTSYDVDHERESGVLFKKADSVVSGVGAAGALIPPFEYHTIENPFDERAVTIHVYKGELTWCHAFEPLDDKGWHRRTRRALVYTV